MANQVFELDDGTKITAPELAEELGVHISTAYSRLYRSTDPGFVLKPKRNKHSKEDEELRQRLIEEAKINDPMFVLFMKTTGSLKESL